MSKKLVIVESPSKAKTIKKYLGSTYSVEASMGHIIDLPKSQMGIDVDKDFEPRYITIRGKGELLSKLKKEAKAADKVYLATDPDREGEAISWHLAHALELDEKSLCRVTFNEITKTAVQKAIKEPRQIDQSLVDAQQARRVLDRIVGYKISPILWKKVKKGLSAGRVQSVATRLICDREEEIEAFVPQEYWTITAELTAQNSKKSFKALYYGEGKKKVELKSESEASKVLNDVKNAQFTVESVKTTDVKRSPAPPFTTSTMQQEASRKINFQSRRTMQTAQTLYEGVDIKGIGTVGLITYMRTDSTRIAQEAMYAAKDYIVSNYGDKYAPASFRYYKSRKNAQDAHEAIRPTDVMLTPARIKDSLTNDQYKLYKLIWERFIASQMESALIESTLCDISAGKHSFKATGSKVKFEGFMKVYIEGTDTEKQKETALVPLASGEVLSLKEIESNQHFTTPPARYTEASLVKALEEEGIGRPSTFAPTITTILARGYVTREKKSLIPTELGRVTTELLKNNFKDIVDVDFTANMESQLDSVESGDIEWKALIKEFYYPFDDVVKKAEKEVSHVKLSDEVSDVKCEKCGRLMVYKMGRYGRFLACPGFPECRNAKPVRTEAGVDCPLCGKKVLVKKSKTGRTYYGCEDNPGCGFMTWDTPVKDKKCPKCGSLLLKKNTRSSKKTVCANENCDYETGDKK